MVSRSIPGPDPLGASGPPHPGCHNQVCLQALPSVPWPGGKVTWWKTTILEPIFTNLSVSNVKDEAFSLCKQLARNPEQMTEAGRTVGMVKPLFSNISHLQRCGSLPSCSWGKCLGCWTKLRFLVSQPFHADTCVMGGGSLRRQTKERTRAYESAFAQTASRTVFWDECSLRTEVPRQRLRVRC